MHSSDTALVEAPAEVTTGIFLFAAASRSMLSKPTPARPMHLSLGACSIRAAVRVVALLTMTPSALCKASCKLRSCNSSIFAPRSASRSKPQGARPSVTSTVGWSAWVSTEAAAASRIRIALTFVLVLRTESSTRGDGVRVLRSSERLVVQPACAAAGEHLCKGCASRGKPCAAKRAVRDACLECCARGGGVRCAS